MQRFWSHYIAPITLLTLKVDRHDSAGQMRLLWPGELHAQGAPPKSHSDSRFVGGLLCQDASELLVFVH